MPLRIKVKVEVDGDRMIVDFSEMNAQTAGPINSGYSGGLAAARVAFKCLTQPNAPVNEGCFRPLEIVLPEGKILNAKPPAALGLWSIALPTVIDTILKALAPVLPDKIPAAHKGDMGGCSIGGFRPDGRRFLLMNIFGGGWGGRPHEDGESASVSICQGDVRSAPIELQEIQYPFLIERFALRTDSGGAGLHRGGLGVELTYRALQSCVANINCERTKNPPWGLNGGKPGAVNEATLIRRDGSEQKLKKATGVRMEAGDRMTFLTAGGGGWGDPKTRARKAVEDDVRAGYVSARGGAARLRRSRRGAKRSGGVGAARMANTKQTLGDERRQRLAAAMREAGLDHVLLYGNAWQGDYLRYGADFGILEGHGLALVDADGAVELFLDSATDAERAELEAPGVRVHFAADIARAVGRAARPRRQCAACGGAAAFHAAMARRSGARLPAGRRDGAPRHAC